MQNKKPKHLLIFKIIGFFAIIVAIIGTVLTVTGFGDFQSNKFMVGAVMSCFGFFTGFTCLTIGFGPEISSRMTKTAKYIQKQNQEDLTEIANTSADIQSEALSKKVKAVKKGLKDTLYCKYCGAEIDIDSKFCSSCGEKLN